MTQPIAQALSARLRDMILAGEFQAGQHLREVQLAQLFGASRTPVRLALAANEKDGLLEYSPNRGYVVRPFAGEDIAAAFEMRAQIEGLAARKAAERGLSPEAARRIAETIDTDARVLSGDAPLDDGAREAWRANNAVFHKTIIEAADNRFIGPALQTVQRIPGVYPPVLASYDPVLLRKYNGHHRRIGECILARQGTRAEFLMREHVFEAGEDILTSLHPAHGPAQDLAGAAE
ncbi:GntR family transcriptional regulator [Methylobacterium sp. J-076]|jgi:GntR family transcriptional regulator of vanillate catabolism|uniref:GntR family transcriptional regulator n=1 Tax=Methylobacterium sp. J-076 TaxID=2836655 RepID=UPI001FB97AE4|nr:GntR family transcriptional regulator [Methylobacterium sp. J-076]MCJ2012473.1 GntR family transcriptional regulator [Methylobacterium sp. J-076]